MASTPTKRKLADVDCYIHTVSPVKKIKLSEFKYKQKVDSNKPYVMTQTDTMILSPKSSPEMQCEFIKLFNKVTRTNPLQILS